MDSRNVTGRNYAFHLLIPKAMRSCGNKRLNELLEGMAKSGQKPAANCDRFYSKLYSRNMRRQTREQWIKSKYEHKKFLKPPPLPSDLNFSFLFLVSFA